MLKIGQRVELHPATSAWMAGDRYGAVSRVIRGQNDTVWYGVRLDKSERVRYFHAGNIFGVLEGAESIPYHE